MTSQALLTTQEAADILRLSRTNLEKRRVYGTGPKFLRLGRSVRYRYLDVIHWAESGLRRSTSDEGGCDAIA